jgi:hypothetical protein
MHRTPEQIRTLGLAALKRALGPAGMVRFLQQFDPGSGDWTSERAAWAGQMALDDVRKAASKRRRPRRTRTP